MAALEKSGVKIITAPTVDCEPTRELFETVLSFARTEKIDGVLGIGGGSAIDVAKLVAALCRGSQKITEVFSVNLLRSRELPLVCLPTTAGTGAEVSPNAILLDESDELKKGVVSPHLVPDAAFVDPLLTISVPPAVTAATGIDALTHCIEAYANKFAHPIVDTYALQGIKLISANLVRAVRNGQDLDARAALALAVFTAGFALARSTPPPFTRWPIRLAENFTSHMAFPTRCCCRMFCVSTFSPRRNVTRKSPRPSVWRGIVPIWARRKKAWNFCRNCHAIAACRKNFLIWKFRLSQFRRWPRRRCRCSGC